MVIHFVKMLCGESENSILFGLGVCLYPSVVCQSNVEKHLVRFLYLYLLYVLFFINPHLEAIFSSDH